MVIIPFSDKVCRIREWRNFPDCLRLSFSCFWKCLNRSLAFYIVDVTQRWLVLTKNNNWTPETARTKQCMVISRKEWHRKNSTMQIRIVWGRNVVFSLMRRRNRLVSGRRTKISLSIQGLYWGMDKRYLCPRVWDQLV